MLSQLKLLHARIGDLIEQAESGALQVVEVVHSRELVLLENRDTIVVGVRRRELPKSCDHVFRRIASGEYECTRPGCGIITDDVENEQWQ